MPQADKGVWKRFLTASNWEVVREDVAFWSQMDLGPSCESNLLPISSISFPGLKTLQGFCFKKI